MTLKGFLERNITTIYCHHASNFIFACLLVLVPIQSHVLFSYLYLTFVLSTFMNSIELGYHNFIISLLRHQDCFQLMLFFHPLYIFFYSPQQ